MALTIECKSQTPVFHVVGETHCTDVRATTERQLNYHIWITADEAILGCGPFLCDYKDIEDGWKKVLDTQRALPGQAEYLYTRLSCELLAVRMANYLETLNLHGHRQQIGVVIYSGNTNQGSIRLVRDY